MIGKKLSAMAAALLAAALLLPLCGCAVVGLEPASEAPAQIEEDGQNPVMNFIGEYACDRALMTVMAKGMEEAEITVHWGSSAWEDTEWVMTGKFDEATLSVPYADCVRKDVVYADNGEISSETVVYENGTGTIRFLESENGVTVEWADDVEHAADGLVFEWSFVS